MVLNTLLGFLLKRMKNEHRSGKLNGINGPERVSVVIGDHLQHARTAKPFQDFRIDVFSTQLSLKESKANHVPNCSRKRLQVLVD
jgi:hypothetical protein